MAGVVAKMLICKEITNTPSSPQSKYLDFLSVWIWILAHPHELRSLLAYFLHPDFDQFQIHTWDFLLISCPCLKQIYGLWLICDQYKSAKASHKAAVFKAHRLIFSSYFRHNVLISSHKFRHLYTDVNIIKAVQVDFRWEKLNNYLLKKFK